MKNLRLVVAALIAAASTLFFTAGSAHAYPDCGIELSLTKSTLVGGGSFEFKADAGSIDGEWVVTYDGESKTGSGPVFTGSFDTPKVTKKTTTTITADYTYDDGDLTPKASGPAESTVTPAFYSTGTASNLQAAERTCSVSSTVTLLPEGSDPDDGDALPNTGGSNILWLLVGCRTVAARWRRHLPGSSASDQPLRLITKIVHVPHRGACTIFVSQPATNLSECNDPVRLSPATATDAWYRKITRAQIGWAVLGVVVLLALVFALQAIRASAALRLAANQAQVLQNQIVAGDDVAAEDTLEALTESSAKAKGSTDGILWDIGSKVPYFGKNVSAIQHVSEAIDTIATDALPPVVELSAQVNLNTFSPHDGKVDMAAIEEIGPSVADASKALTAANDRIRGINAGSLIVPLRGPVVSIQAKVTRPSRQPRRRTSLPSCCPRCWARTPSGATSCSSRAMPRSARPAGSPARSRS